MRSPLPSVVRQADGLLSDSATDSPFTPRTEPAGRRPGVPMNRPPYQGGPQGVSHAQLRPPPGPLLGKGLSIKARTTLRQAQGERKNPFEMNPTPLGLSPSTALRTCLSKPCIGENRQSRKEGETAHHAPRYAATKTVATTNEPAPDRARCHRWDRALSGPKKVHWLNIPAPRGFGSRDERVAFGTPIVTHYTSPAWPR